MFSTSGPLPASRGYSPCGMSLSHGHVHAAATPPPGMETWYRSQVDKLTQENHALQEEIRALRRMIGDKDKKIPSYEAALDKLQRKYTETLAQLDQEREKSYSGLALMNSRESRYSRQQKLIEELQEEVRNLRSSEAAARAYMEAERQAAGNSQGQLEEALRASRVVNQDAQQLNHEIKILQKALREEQERCALLQQQIALNRASEDRANLRASTASAEIEELKQRHQVELHDLKRMCDDRVEDAKKSARRKVEAEQESKDELVRRTQQTVDDLRKELESAHRDLSQERARSRSSIGSRGGGGAGGAGSGSPGGVGGGGMGLGGGSMGMGAAGAGSSMGAFGSPSPYTAHSGAPYGTHPAATGLPQPGIANCTDVYNAGFMDALTSSSAVDECCRKDAPSLRRMRRGKGALPIDRSLDGDLIATCRRRHCLRRFNVNDNSSAMCGYHPVTPTTSYDGDYYACCGVLIRPGAPNVFCQFRPHLA